AITATSPADLGGLGLDAALSAGPGDRHAGGDAVRPQADRDGGPPARPGQPDRRPGGARPGAARGRRRLGLARERPRAGGDAGGQRGHRLSRPTGRPANRRRPTGPAYYSGSGAGSTLADHRCSIRARCHTTTETTHVITNNATMA